MVVTVLMNKIYISLLRTVLILLVMLRPDIFLVLVRKLNDPHIGATAYWSILNKFLHKKKIPLIPPILVNDLQMSLKRPVCSTNVLQISAQ